MSHDKASGRAVAPDRFPSARRRIAATAVDDALLASAAAGLWLLARRAAVRPGGAPVPRVTSFLLLSGPATVALALLDATGGSPGKRLLGLRVVPQEPASDEASNETRHETLGVRAHPRRVGPARALLRTAVKVGLPWELAHAAVWRLRAEAAARADGGGDGGGGGGAWLAACYAVAGAELLTLFAGTPVHDRLAGTRVVGR